MSPGFFFCFGSDVSFTYVDFGIFLRLVEAINTGGKAKNRQIKTYTHNSYHHDI